MPVKPEHRVLTYVAELELEVDRLRKHSQLLYEDAVANARAVLHLCESAENPHTATLKEIESTCHQTLQSIRDLRATPAYHPSGDQVTDIAFRPLVEKVFRWQQRLSQLPMASLHLDLQQENLAWFPARLSHILENLIGNALEFCDSDKGEVRVIVGLRQDTVEYELRVSDNGLGIEDSIRPALLGLAHRANSTLPRRPGVGLAVVQMLIEESGGTLSIASQEGAGTSFVARLPRYDLDDFLTDGEQLKTAAEA